MSESRSSSSSGKGLLRARHGVCLVLMLLLAACLLCSAWERASAAASAEPTAGRAARMPRPTGSELRFLGNKALGERELREAAEFELERFKQMGFRRADADDAAFQMELAYRRLGYPFASVDYEYEIVGDKAQVTFRFDEGPRVRIDRIEISGNETFSDSQIRSFFEEEDQGPLEGPLYYNQAQLEGSVADIRDLYYEQGFLDSRIEEPEVEFSGDRRLAAIHITIQEGARYLIEGVRLQGDLYTQAHRELAEIRQELLGEPFNKRKTLELRSRIREVYGNLGYPEAEVTVKEEQAAQPFQVILAAEIMSGPQVAITDILIQGNEKTRESFIRSRLALEPGDTYSARKQRESFGELYRTGLFSRVDLSLEEGPEPGQRLLLVEVEELPSRELSLEAGWGSYELLRLRLGYQEKNPFGTGRTFRTELGGSAKGADLTANIIDPWFLRTDFTATLPFFIKYRQEPSFTRQEIGSSLLFSRELSETLRFSTSYNIRNTVLTNIDLDTPLEEPDDNYNLASIKAQLTDDTRNDIFFPTEGQMTYLTGEVADSVLGSQIAFFRLTAGASRFFSLGQSTVLALRYNTGFIAPNRGQDTIPLGERFYNGGENTVRSFRQDQLGPRDVNGDPIGGTAFNVLTAELRYQLTGPLIGTLFFDYGNISPNQEALFGTSESELTSATFDQYFRDMRPAVGAGLQYLLPIGPARLDVAYNPVAQEGERDYTIHFSVGMAF